ncbi:MAG: AI-2E family transporter [Oscillospiraceae bacterium]|nr:AI-2E family transporter [Oscillospiraceae bacterium]
MKFNKIPYFRYLPVIIITLFLVRIINQTNFAFSSINVIIQIISPIFYGFAIAYILNPAMNFLIKRFSIKAQLSIFIVYFSFIMLIVLSIGFIIPVVIRSISDLTQQIPNYINNISNLATQFSDVFNNFDFSKILTDNLSILGNELRNYFTSILSSGFSAVAVTAQAFFTVSLSILLSIYFLSSKNQIKSFMIKLLYAFLKKETADTIIEYASDMHLVFSQYINGKLLESLILSVIASLGLTIIRVPYALLMAVVVGITNLIPYIGPFIGMVTPVVIAFFNRPLSAIFVIIFLLVLQQFESLWLGPKILGNKVGLSPASVIIAIIVGNSLLGIPGMLISIPVFAFIKVSLNKYIQRRYDSKNKRFPS